MRRDRDLGGMGMDEYMESLTQKTKTNQQHLVLSVSDAIKKSRLHVILQQKTNNQSCF